MNKEILRIVDQLNDVYEGDPWFGRSIKSILAEIGEQIAFEKPADQHSIIELLWHMINWREFTINNLDPASGKTLSYFEKNDWIELDHSDKSLFQKALDKIKQTQEHLVNLLKLQQDELLDKKIGERNYNFRKLLYGIIQHDIYHLGQIIYIKKLLVNK